LSSFKTTNEPNDLCENAYESTSNKCSTESESVNASTPISGARDIILYTVFDVFITGVLKLYELFKDMYASKNGIT
jgi:hypothetical protein